MLHAPLSPEIKNIAILFEEGLTVGLELRQQKRGFWERLNESLLTKLHRSHREVRGIGLAADHLVRALAMKGTATRLTLHHDRQAAGPASEYLRDLKRTVTRQVEIKQASLGNRSEIALSSTPPEMWLNLSPYQTRWGGVERSQAVRLASCGLTYPILTLLHGLSAHSMLSSVFFPLLLGGSFPYDTLITTSTAAAKATENILAGVSEAFAAQYGVTLTYRGRVDTIPLCVDVTQSHLGERTRSRKHLSLSPDSLIILYIGRISPLKADLMPFIGMLSRLAKRYPQKNLVWIIAGTAEEGYLEQLLRAATSAGVAKQLMFLLQVNEELKQQLLSAADIFFSPSDSIQESCGLTPLEAMAAGLPQVVADWDGYRDTVVHGETGFLIPTYWTDCDGDLLRTGSVLGWSFDHLQLGQSVAVDVCAAEQSMQQLIESPELRARMSKASRERAEANYSYGVIARRYEELGQALGEMARSHPLEGVLPRFSQTAYSRYFRDHASEWIDGAWQVQLTSLGSAILLQGVETGKAASLPHEVVDEQVVWPLLTRFADAKSGTLSFGELCSDRESSQTADVVKRHLMWLIKQGWIQPIPTGQPPTRIGVHQKF